MPPNVNGPFDRDRMARRVHRLTAGVAVAATAATLGLTVFIAGGQADADTGTGESATDPAATSTAPNQGSIGDAPGTTEPRTGSGSTGSRTAPSTRAPSQLSQAPAPTQARGRSHAGSGGS